MHGRGADVPIAAEGARRAEGPEPPEPEYVRRVMGEIGARMAARAADRTPAR